MCVCVSNRLSDNGLARLGESLRGIGKGRTLPIRLVEGFGGISGARRALEILGITPMFHFHIENNPRAHRVVSCQYPDAKHFSDITTFTAEDLAQAVAGAAVLDASGPRAKM